MMNRLSYIVLAALLLVSAGCSGDQKVDEAATKQSADRLTSMKEIFDKTPDKKWDSVAASDRERMIKENGSETEAKKNWELFANPPKLPTAGPPGAG